MIYILFLGILVGIILNDVKHRFGEEIFWFAVGVVTFLSLGALVAYRNIL